MPTQKKTLASPAHFLSYTDAWRRISELHNAVKEWSNQKAIAFTGVSSVAWPDIVSTLATLLRKNSDSIQSDHQKTFQKQPNLWIIAPTVKAQLFFFEQSSSKLPDLQLLEKLPNFSEEELAAELLDPALVAKRWELLGKVARGENTAILLSLEDLNSPVPTAKALNKEISEYQIGWEGEPADLIKELEAAGLQPSTQVVHHGEYALRGGIVDFFAWQAEFPCRIEFDEEAIASLRHFDRDTQITFEKISSYRLQSNSLSEKKGTHQEVALRDYIQPKDQILLLGEELTPKQQAELQQLHSSPCYLLENIALPSWLQEQQYRSIALECFPLETAHFRSGDFLLQEKRRHDFFNQMADWHQEGWQLFLLSEKEAPFQRFLELLKEEREKGELNLPAEAFSWSRENLRGSYYLPQQKIAALSLQEIFGQSAQERLTLSQKKGFSAQELHKRNPTNFKEFEEGDFVVHPDYGIAYYQGVETQTDAWGKTREVLALEFAEEARLLVPIEEAWKISRYIGLGKAIPSLSSLDDHRWQKSKKAAQKSIFLYAGKLLQIEAKRALETGYAFGPDTTWQAELEAAFPYQETPDQLRAIAEIKHDMESPIPMDRLLCGDVGFGKTEVALRAAFKAVMEGKQVVFLAPTTVLTQQHYQTLRERMSAYPVNIALLNRYRKPQEQKEILAQLAVGSIDIIVGTHRLFSKDVTFRDLGLVIIDEEQRFGVNHKEAFKERYHTIDVLTLSATPIPRTLYFSLMGTRSMSQLETPPARRQPVTTIVTAYDERLIKKAIERELDRGGQIYFLHNRVGSIEKVAGRIQKLFPKIKIVIGHGQMPKQELENVMQRFVSGQAEILIATTIIESGLDIPNANTIIIDRADLFGLADLYQLRGRVGRSHQKAYAYLMLPRQIMLQGEARRRVRAIKQYDQLGAGFKIAMRDLEIRGAGNILGTAQSGHITTIGFELYCKMLQHAIKERQSGINTYQEAEADNREAYVHLDFVITSTEEWEQFEREHRNREKREKKRYYPLKLPAFLATSFLQESSLRIQLYQELAEANSLLELEQLKTHWEDRFGKLPSAAQHLITLTKIRYLAQERNILRVETRDKKLMLERAGSWILLGSRFPQLTAWKPEEKLTEIMTFLEGMSQSR